jgi:drug/metabolite transporter (DMT)-like permease
MMQWGLMAFVGVVGTALSYPLYSMVIDRMGGGRATMIVGSLVPVLAGLGAYFMFGEMASVEQIAGGVFIIGALVVNGLCG